MSAANDLIDAAKRGDLERATRILSAAISLANSRDEDGATPLHYAAIHGHQKMVRLLVEHGASINSSDSRFGATPAGWAIEYMRDMGAYLGIELDDFAYAIRQGDAKWAARFLKRFPGLRQASAPDGTPFRTLARESGNAEIVALFDR